MASRLSVSTLLPFLHSTASNALLPACWTKELWNSKTLSLGIWLASPQGRALHWHLGVSIEHGKARSISTRRSDRSRLRSSTNRPWRRHGASKRRKRHSRRSCFFGGLCCLPFSCSPCSVQAARSHSEVDLAFIPAGAH